MLYCSLTPQKYGIPILIWMLSVGYQASDMSATDGFLKCVTEILV